MHSHEKFSSRIGFLLAAIGAAVGLGNIWQFPYMLGSQGGAAFLVIYLLTIFLIALPVMIGEMILGRRGGMSAPQTLAKIAMEEGSSSTWRLLGWWGIAALFFVLSFFSVIGGWSLAYVFKVATGTFNGLSPEAVGGEFGSFTSSPSTLILWHAIFMACTIFIISRGVKSGIEKAVSFMMPTLFLMLVGLVVYGMVAGDFAKAAGFLFKPDLSKVNPEMALAAVGQAFFSVNVGIGALLTYAAYLPKETNIVRSAGVIAVGDTLIALLAGLMIFPIVFANDLNPGAGPGLIFVTMSTAFGQMPGGQIFGTVFFVLVFFAALTSAMSMLEVITCRLVEFKGFSRPAVAVSVGTIIFLLGFLSVFSQNELKDVFPLGGIALFEGKTFFDLKIYLVNSIFLPVGALLYAVFIGWFVSRKTALSELKLNDGAGFALWRFLMRYGTPVVLLFIFYNSFLKPILDQ